MVNHEDVVRIFDEILEPKINWSINALNLLKDVEIQKQKIIVHINLITEDKKEIKQFIQHVESAIARNFFITSEVIVGKAVIDAEGVKGVKKILIVAGGKGGVGKSTIAANLAGSFVNRGFKVGLIDADIYGPSIPGMLGCYDKPEIVRDENLEPIDRFGIKFISAASMIDKGKALGWRGPMVSGMLIQFIKKTLWRNIDFLIIDFPPGTGDIHLTVAKSLKIDGVVMVTTPPEIVWGDVRRSMDLFQKQDIPILGIVENMSYSVCDNCGHAHQPFVSTKNDWPEGIKLLGKIPLSKEISQSGDNGIPYVIANKETAIAKDFLGIVNKLFECSEEKSAKEGKA